MMTTNKNTNSVNLNKPIEWLPTKIEEGNLELCVNTALMLLQFSYNVSGGWSVIPNKKWWELSLQPLQ